ncbi:MAG: leucine-rich repeat protein [Mogibacterium sp.]|nr:leucine-rich repeat protein [Mogibacterium sp.]
MNGNRSISKRWLAKFTAVLVFAAVMIIGSAVGVLAFSYEEEESRSNWDKEKIKMWEFDTSAEFHSLGDHGLLWDGLYYGSSECVLYGVGVSAAVSDSGVLPVPSSISTPNGTKKVVGIISIDAESGLESFDANPFMIANDYDSITSIELPSSVRYIGKRAFAKNETLKSVKFGGPVIICNGAFANCKALTDAWAPDGSTVSSNAFFNCVALKRMNCAPESLEMSGYFSMFEPWPEDFSLEEVVYAPQVKTAGGLTYFEHLKKVTLPDGLITIDADAFSCTSLGSLMIPDTVQNIDDGAFENCPELTGITRLPRDIKYVGRYAFAGCPKLHMDVVFPPEQKYLSKGVFMNSGITSFTWNCKQLIEFDLSAFNGCRNLKSINMNVAGFWSRDGVLYFDSKTESGSVYKHELVRYPAGLNRRGTFTVPEDVSAIYEHAFEACSLTDIYLPHRMFDYSREGLLFYDDDDWFNPDTEAEESRHPFDFMDCQTTIHGIPYFLSGGEYVTGTPENIGFGFVNGKKITHKFVSLAKPAKGKTFTYGKIKYKITKTCGSKQGEVMVIGASSKSRTKVTIPTFVYYKDFPFAVTSIKSKAFSGFKKLKTVDIKDRDKFKITVGKNAFANCPKLTKVTLGEGVYSIGANAFYKDKLLKTIIVNSTKLKKVGKKSLSGISKNAKIKVPAKKYKTYKKLFKGKGQKKTVKIIKVKASK